MMVPALAEAQAARIERLKRMGGYGAIIAPAPEPTPAPAQVEAVAVPEGRDWLDVASPALTPVSTKSVLSVVAKAYGVTPLEILSRRRNSSVLVPRMVVCWILRNHSRLSLPQIGMRLGGRDHTTVLHSVRKADDLRVRDPEFAGRADNLALAARAADSQQRDAA